MNEVINITLPSDDENNKSFFNLRKNNDVQIDNNSSEIEEVMLSYMVKDVKYIKEMLEAGVDSKWFFDKELKAFFQRALYYYNNHRIVFSKKLFLERVEATFKIKKIENPIIAQYEQFYDQLLEYDFGEDEFKIKIAEWRDYVVQQTIKEYFKDYSYKLEAGESVIDGFDFLNKKLTSIKSIYDSNKTYKIASLSKDSNMVYEDFLNRKENPEMFCGYSTGFDALDERFSGIEKSKMVVIMGMSSSGKTTLARNITRHVQKKHKAKVCVLTCEETRLDYMSKIVCAELNISLSQGKKGMLNDEQLDDIRNKKLELENEGKLNDSCYEIIEVDARKYTIEELYNIIESEYGKNYFDVVLLDHLSLVKAAENIGKEHIELGDVSKFFRDMARKYNFAAILIAQANRGSAKFVRGKREVEMYLENLEGSNKPGQDTDKALAVRIDANDPSIAIIKVVKDREGERDYEIEVANMLHYSKFENLSIRDDFQGELTQEIYEAHQVTIDDEGRTIDSRSGEILNIPVKKKEVSFENEEEVPSVLGGSMGNNGPFSFFTNE